MDNTLNPIVSVIVPTYNSERTLKTCLESVYKETHPEIEVIVIDNFSNDDTKDIALENGATCIKYRGGRAEARNLGLLNSRGDYVLFLDSDQELTPGTLTDCVQACIKSGVDSIKIREIFVGGDFWGKCSALWKNTMVRAWGEDGGIPRFFNRSTLTEGEAFINRAAFWEDQEYYDRLRRVGLKVAWSSTPILHLETGSMNSFIRKYLTYGTSTTALPNLTSKRNLIRTVKLTLKTLRLLLRNPVTPIRTYFGAFIATWIKALSFSLGLLKGILH